MLVLARKVREEIVIDEEIVLTVVEITPGVVRIGITAPKDVPIRRGELPPRPEDRHEDAA